MCSYQSICCCIFLSSILIHCQQPICKCLAAASQIHLIQCLIRELCFVLIGTGKRSQDTKNGAIGLYWKIWGYVVSWFKVEQFKKLILFNNIFHVTRCYDAQPQACQWEKGHTLVFKYCLYVKQEFKQFSSGYS